MTPMVHSQMRCRELQWKHYQNHGAVTAQPLHCDFISLWKVMQLYTNHKQHRCMRTRAMWSWLNIKGTQWHYTHTHTHTLTTIKQECHKTGTRCEETGTYHLAVWDWHQRSLGDQGQWWPAWCDQHALSEPTGGLLATCWMWTMRPTPPLLHWAHLEKTGSHVCKALPAPWLDRELAQSRKASLVKVWKRGKHKQ